MLEVLKPVSAEYKMEATRVHWGVLTSQDISCDIINQKNMNPHRQVCYKIFGLTKWWIHGSLKVNIGYTKRNLVQDFRISDECNIDMSKYHYYLPCSPLSGLATKRFWVSVDM